MPAPKLEDAISQYGHDAYLLTIGTTGPHTSSVTVELHGNVITCLLGSSAAKNITRDPNVSLFWPPQEKGGYALILNGTANETTRPGGTIVAEITLTKSVFHRPGPRGADSDGPCASDCKRIRIGD